MTQHTHKGFIAITSVLILSAIFLSLSITLITHALAGSDAQLSTYAHDTAEVTAESCVEYALHKLQQSSDYAGGEGILVGTESCRILAIGGTGNTQRTIHAESIVSGYLYRTIVVVEQIFPETRIASWKWVTQF